MSLVTSAMLAPENPQFRAIETEAAQIGTRAREMRRELRRHVNRWLMVTGGAVSAILLVAAGTIGWHLGRQDGITEQRARSEKEIERQEQQEQRERQPRNRREPRSETPAIMPAPLPELPPMAAAPVEEAASAGSDAETAPTEPTGDETETETTAAETGPTTAETSETGPTTAETSETDPAAAETGPAVAETGPDSGDAPTSSVAPGPCIDHELRVGPITIDLALLTPDPPCPDTPPLAVPPVAKAPSAVPPEGSAARRPKKMSLVSRPRGAPSARRPVIVAPPPRAVAQSTHRPRPGRGA